MTVRIEHFSDNLQSYNLVISLEYLPILWSSNREMVSFVIRTPFYHVLFNPELVFGSVASYQDPIVSKLFSS